MPRIARNKSKTGIYHVIVRGINRQDIFQDEEDKGVYLDRLSRYKSESGFEIYAYCLMNNHVHLLIKEGKESISEVMKKIGTSYVYWYNRKYERVGHLFQDRYKSEPVENDEYSLIVTRYIHQNPVKVGQAIDEWTSYKDYINNLSLTDTNFILEIFNIMDSEKAKKLFTNYMNEINEDICLDIMESKRLADTEAKSMIEQIGRISNCQDLQNFEKINRDIILRKLKNEGISIRQIERLTGINRGVGLKLSCLENRPLDIRPLDILTPRATTMTG